MKSVFVFLVLLALAFCPPPEFSREARQQKREQLQKELADCILKSESVSSELKKQIEESKGEELRKVLYLYITKLDQNDREIIRKCRRELLGKMREIHKNWFQNRFNNTFFPFRHKGNNQ